MPSAVEQGLKAAVKANIKKAEEHAEDARGLRRIDIQWGEVGSFSQIEAAAAGGGGGGGEGIGGIQDVYKCKHWDQKAGCDLVFYFLE